MDDSFCLPDHKYPDTGQPSTCYYDSKNGGNWFAIDLESSSSTEEVVSLVNKQFDYTSSGSLIPEGQRPTAYREIESIYIAPNNIVRFYDNNICTGEPSLTVAGSYVEQTNPSPDYVYANGYLNIDNFSEVRCLKVSVAETWDSFVEACRGGSTPQSACQQYASTGGTGGTGGGVGTDGGTASRNNRFLSYAVLGLGILFIIAVVVLAILAMNYYHNEAKKTRPVGPVSFQPPPQTQQYYQPPPPLSLEPVPAVVVAAPQRKVTFAPIPSAPPETNVTEVVTAAPTRSSRIGTGGVPADAPALPPREGTSGENVVYASGF